MSRQRRTFSPELKLAAVRFVVGQGYSISDAARSQDVGTTAIRRWLRRHDAGRSGEAPASKALTMEQLRIQEFEARIKRRDWEKEITKKGYRSLSISRDKAYALIDRLSE